MTYAEWKTRLTQGNAFDDADVARCYAHRPPYAPAAFNRVLDLTARKEQLVDLGCGPGKVAAELAPHFTHTLALDPAAAMIDEAKRLHAASNITWLHARAEETTLPDRIDLVTAGTAIHWMNHAVLFPRLAERTNLLALLSVETPPGTPWDDAYRDLMTDWLARVGQVYDPAAFHQKNHAYERWLDIAGRGIFSEPFTQRVEDFIDNLHSTATFSRARMGNDLAARFGEDVRAMLAPHTHNGTITYETRSELVWGAPRRYARTQQEG